MKHGYYADDELPKSVALDREGLKKYHLVILLVYQLKLITLKQELLFQNVTIVLIKKTELKQVIGVVVYPAMQNY